MRDRVKKGPEPEELRPFEFSSTGGLRGKPPSHQPVRGVGMGPLRGLCEPPRRRFRFPPLGVYLPLRRVRREARFSAIGKVVENVNALANAMQKRGFNILTGGTDNHVFLVDLREAGITGKDAQARMDSINVTLNKNGIPFDTVSPFITSGVRIGTAAITSRGFEASEMDEIAGIIEEALLKNPSEAELKALSERAVKLCEKHPLPEYLMSK